MQLIVVERLIAKLSSAHPRVLGLHQIIDLLVLGRGLVHLDKLLADEVLLLLVQVLKFVVGKVV